MKIRNILIVAALMIAIVLVMNSTANACNVGNGLVRATFKSIKQQSVVKQQPVVIKEKVIVRDNFVDPYNSLGIILNHQNFVNNGYDNTALQIQALQREVQRLNNKGILGDIRENRLERLLNRAERLTN